MSMKITDITCSAWNDDGTLFVSAEVDGCLGDVQFCFYIYRSDEKTPILETRYGKSPYLVYRVEWLGKYEIKCFAKNSAGEKTSRIESFELTSANAKSLAQGRPPESVVPAEFNWTSAGYRIIDDEVEFNVEFDFGNNKSYTLRYEYSYRDELVGIYGTTRRRIIRFPLYGAGAYKFACTFRDSATNKEYRKEVKFVRKDTNVAIKGHNTNPLSKYSVSAPRRPVDKMNVVFTIDAEHGCGGNPIRLSGDLSDWGISENFGCRGIMDVFEEFGAHAVFFLNVYEAETFDAAHSDYMRELITEIAARGHEVALHCHGGYKGSLFPFNKESLPALNLEQQRSRLTAGSDFIYNVTGQRPISFRGGAYRINTDTFGALESIGFKYESSCWLSESNNCIPYWRSVSRPIQIGGLIEFPIVPVIPKNGGIVRKLDLDALSAEDIYGALCNLKDGYAIDATQVMFHSFSLLQNRPSRDQMEPLVSFRRGKEYYGGSVENKDKLRNLLARISSSGVFQIKTFEELEKDGYSPTPSLSDGPAFAGKTERSLRLLNAWNKYNICTPEKVVVIPQTIDIVKSFVLSVDCSAGSDFISIRVNLKPWGIDQFKFSFRLVGVAPARDAISTPFLDLPQYLFWGIGPGTYKVECLFRDVLGNVVTGLVCDVTVNSASTASDLERYRQHACLSYSTKQGTDIATLGMYMGVAIGFPFDWSCAGINDRTVCRNLHAFIVLDAVAREYEKTGNAQMGRFMHDYVMDWVRANKKPLSGNNWAWHDDATARRVQRLAYYFRFFSELWSHSELEEIKHSLDMQAALLATDSFYKRLHNHGMYQDFGLLCYALLACDDRDLSGAKYAETAISRALEYFHFVYCDNYVHKEHSPEYALAISRAAYAFSKLLEQKYPKESSTFFNYWNGTQRFITHCTMPNGRLPPLGDSSPIASACEPETCVVFKDDMTGGGYAIFRSSWADSSENATWMMFLAATFSKVHKHSDDLSFVLYHGGELFVEAGKRNYNYVDPMTVYAYSGYAHNVLCVDDRDFPVNVQPHGTREITQAALDTRITAYSIEKNVCSVTGVQRRFPGVLQTRSFSWDKKRNVVTILDQLDSTYDFKASLLFHVAEGVVVTLNKGEISFSRNDAIVATMSIESALPINLKVLQGEGEAPYHAWIFNGKPEPRPGSLIVVDAQCKEGKNRLKTIIRLK